MGSGGHCCISNNKVWNKAYNIIWLRVLGDEEGSQKQVMVKWECQDGYVVKLERIDWEMNILEEWSNLGVTQSN